MPWIVYFIAGGGTFLPGTGLIAIAIISRAIFHRRWIAFLSIVIAIVGMTMVAISAEAIAWWIYGVWITIGLLWFLRGTFASRRLKRILDTGALAATFTAAAIAASFQLRPTVPPGPSSRIYVIGDSISAGIGSKGESTWPELMAAEHGVEVINLSRAGSTISAATRRLQSSPLGDGLVVLEVGGNDILGHATADQFGKDLDALTNQVHGNGRRIIMLELPLFPFDNAYGLEQRRVARKNEIRLIPRRHFAKILAAPGATLDGIHLSETGRLAMAKMVWEVIGPSFR
jgi:lysophospholipase L1-like esterase